MSVFTALPLFALISDKFYTAPSSALGDTQGLVSTPKLGVILPYCNADISCFISSDKKLPYLAVCNVNITGTGLKLGRRHGKF